MCSFHLFEVSGVFDESHEPVLCLRAVGALTQTCPKCVSSQNQLFWDSDGCGLRLLLREN